MFVIEDEHPVDGDGADSDVSRQAKKNHHEEELEGWAVVVYKDEVEEIERKTLKSGHHQGFAKQGDESSLIWGRNV